MEISPLNTAITHGTAPNVSVRKYQNLSVILVVGEEDQSY